MYRSNSEIATRGAEQRRVDSADLTPLFRIWLAFERQLVRTAAAETIDQRAQRQMEILARLQWHIVDLAACIAGKSASDIGEELEAWRRESPQARAENDSSKADADALASLRDAVGVTKDQLQLSFDKT